MDTKVYRNIYFYGSRVILSGNGTMDIQYSGQIFNDARFMKDFNKIYDPEQDLLITCNECASKKYRNIKKI